MSELFLIIVGTGLAGNLVLEHMLGTDPVLAVSRESEPAANLSLLMLIVMPPASAITWLFRHYLLIPGEFLYLQPAVFVLLVTLVVVLAGILLKRFFPEIHSRIEPFIPLVLVNGAILGVALLNIRYEYNLITSFFFGLGAAAGFAVVLLAFTALRERLAADDVPAPFRGTAILMITLGILSMAFMGFNGLGSLQ